MGIRFYCPNGHKLNVKQFQAGRTGICPHCGEKFEIPEQSTRESAKRAEGQPATQPEMPADAETPLQTPPTPPSPQAPAAVEPEPQPVTKPAPQPVSEPAGTPIFRPPQPESQPAGFPQQPSPQTPAGPSQADPLADAGDATWYVRPTGGGQFGPASSQVMRTWIDEGRLDSDSLIWREGWQDWREAGEVFPQLPSAPPAGGGSQSPHGSIAQISPEGTNATRAATARMSRVRARRKSYNTQAIVIILLIFAVVVLAAVFIYVVFGDRADGNASNPSRTVRSDRIHAVFREIPPFA